MARKVRKNVLINKAHAEWLERVSKETGIPQGDILQEAIDNLRHAYIMRKKRMSNDENNSK